MRPKLVVALTGGIGSGKTTVTDMFAELGVKIIDSDVLAREVVEPGRPALEEIVSVFGTDLLDESGQLNRGKLRERVFAAPEKRKTLEGILHPIIIAETDRRVDEVEDSYCLVCIPLLFETNPPRSVRPSAGSGRPLRDTDRTHAKARWLASDYDRGYPCSPG